MKRHTLGELIESLRKLPADAEVNGLTADIFSYRGWYERNCIAPNWDNPLKAHKLADTYSAQIGKLMHGWKGGDYKVSAEELVYLVEEGRTGPCIIGLSRDSVSDIWEPVLLEDDWR